MDADIKLDGERIIVTGNWLEIQTYDVKVDNSERRSSSDGTRRALVHNSNDGLSINFTSDYPGGVTIEGEVAFPDKVSFFSETEFAGDVKFSEFVSATNLHSDRVHGDKIEIRLTEPLEGDPVGFNNLNVELECRYVRKQLLQLKEEVQQLRNRLDS